MTIVTVPIRLLCATAVLLVGTSAALAEPTEKRSSEHGGVSSDDELQAPLPARTGFVDLNGYYDTRAASGMTVNVLANLPGGFQYFSLTNYINPSNAMSLRDQETFYTEQNVRWAPSPGVPVAVTAQWVVRSGEQNDALRLGGLWRVSGTKALRRLFSRIGLSYSIGVHAYQFDFVRAAGWRGQVEHVYKWRPFKGDVGSRFYIGGFMDHNVWLAGPAEAAQSRIVTEHQLAVRVVHGLHLVSELRFNQYLATDKFGVGIGVQYFLPFEIK